MKITVLRACLVVIACSSLFSFRSFCEPTHNSEDSVTQKKKKRPPVTDRLSEDEMNYLTENFYRAQESIQARYDNKPKKPQLFVADGITAALSQRSSEEVLASVFADLLGSMNKTQILELQQKSETLAHSIREQAPEDRDSRLLTLVERGEWVGYILKGKTPPPSSLPLPKDEQAFQNFKKVFLEEHEKVNTANRELLDKIELAKSGDKRAKNDLRNRLDLKSLVPFLQGQSQSGGQALFQNVAEALVWKDDQGTKYHDFANSEGKSIRLVVGQTASDHARQLSSFLKKNPKRLSGFSLSPVSLTSANPEQINLTGKPQLQSQNQNESNQLSTTPLATRALPIFARACAQCHRTNRMVIENFGAAAQAVRNGSMPQPPQTLSDQEKATLIEFFLSSEPKTGFTALTQ